MWRHRWHQEQQVCPSAPMDALMADYGIDDKVPSRVPQQWTKCGEMHFVTGNMS